MTARWVTDPVHPYLEHRDGIHWNWARLPLRWHRCKPQTRGTEGRWTETHERCACGAERRIGVLTVGRWTGKNSCRQARKERSQ